MKPSWGFAECVWREKQQLGHVLASGKCWALHVTRSVQPIPSDWFCPCSEGRCSEEQQPPALGSGWGRLCRICAALC